MEDSAKDHADLHGQKLTWNGQLCSNAKLSFFFLFSSCDADGVNKLESDIEKGHFDLKCAANNEFETVDWPNCVDSKFFTQNRYTSTVFINLMIFVDVDGTKNMVKSFIL